MDGRVAEGSSLGFRVSWFGFWFSVFEIRGEPEEPVGEKVERKVEEVVSPEPEISHSSVASPASVVPCV